MCSDIDLRTNARLNRANISCERLPFTRKIPSLKLYFATHPSVSLERILFSHPLIDCENVAIRGKGVGAFKGACTFRWTTAVRALCLLTLRTVIAHRTSLNRTPAPVVLRGMRGSLASSLDDAISKQPNWLADLFGCDSRGTALIKRLTSRSNSGGKRVAPISIAWNSEFFSVDKITIFRDELEINGVVELNSILEKIEQEQRLLNQVSAKANRSTQDASVSTTSNHRTGKKSVVTLRNSAIDNLQGGRADFGEVDSKTDFIWQNDAVMPRLVVCDNPELLGSLLARCLATLIQNKPNTCTILPTGRTAALVFRSAIDLAEQGIFPSLARTHFFVDTETFGVTCKHPTSRVRFVREFFFESLSRTGVQLPPEDNCHFLQGYIENDEHYHLIDRKIKEYPPDLHIASISPSGELLGYEASTYCDIPTLMNTRTGIIQVSRRAKDYIDDKQPAQVVVSIGMANLLSSRFLILAVSGSTKNGALSNLLKGQISAAFPATLTRYHTSSLIVADRYAADGLEFPKCAIGSELEVIAFAERTFGVGA